MFGEQWIAQHPILVIIMIAWSLPWKGWALWRASRRNDTYWFIAFLLVHTLGILEIIYLFFVTGNKDNKSDK